MSETARLSDRRALVSGDRAFTMGDETGLYPATGWHIRGEMGGFWAPPVKLLDGVWFAADGSWFGKDIPATRYVRGQGYQRFEYRGGGISAERVEFVPSGSRATVIGLTLRADRRRDVRLDMDAHSELMPAYPWGWTTPNAGVNAPDTGSVSDGALVFQDPVGAAAVGASAQPVEQALGPHHRGPQDPAVVCPADGPAPTRCDDSAFGKGTGGRLAYSLRLAAGRPTTIWFAVAGGDTGTQARDLLNKVLRDPADALRQTVSARRAAASSTVVDLPGDRLLQQSIEWSKQNLLDSVQEARNARIRDVNEGKDYPPPAGTVPKMRWLAAGFPDYPWLFATDGEYTAYAAVAAGQFDIVRDHLRALRDVSDMLNNRSGKVVHEVVSTGDVYFGSNKSAGNTDETAKFPSTVALVWRWTGDTRFRDEMYDFAVRNLRYITGTLDKDGDGWPEGLGNVERQGMGEEKLDSTVYLIRGLRDLADMAASKHDRAVAQWATTKADDLQRRFEAQWWVEQGVGYAESIDDPANPANDNTPVFQRHWTGITPMEAGPIASADKGRRALVQRERDCYNGEFGTFHTGTGPTSAPAGNPGPSCDPIVSTVASERATYSLNTAVMAVAEGNFGRLDAQRRYTTGNARIQLDPSVWETPGAMPEVAPSPDFKANIDRPFYDRSMNLQAWGTYGTLWPVVHQQLGVAPDLGNGRLAVIPQLPDGQNSISGREIRVGRGSVDVSVSRSGNVYRTEVRSRSVDAALTVGLVVPQVSEVRLDGKPVSYQLMTTARGTEVRVALSAKTARLEIRTR
ncbi:glycogen debranching protein [Kibdelosporangium aridum]|uniref:Glycogen debranching protein n=1 Tax=Kibdelosporangium aridum TaxID=2030 RepID=A0A428ZKZ3_KIBAR|nr:glycogen debranching protein [Kibdelosporangium aridum]